MFRFSIIVLLCTAFPLSVVADDIRVMSFNLRYGAAQDGPNHWDLRKEFVAETILAYAPDLLGTQETLGFQKHFLETKMAGYTSVGVGRDNGGDDGEMTAIFFKADRFELLDKGHFWLSETPEVVGSVSWDSSLTRMASWVRLKDRRGETERPMLFVNTHFDHKGSLARAESAALIRKTIARIGVGCDLILTGDFNAAADSEPYRILFDTTSERVAGGSSPRQPVFTDTYREAKPDDAPGGATFSGFRDGVVDGNRIDWIAVAGNWKILSADIDRIARDGRTPSDHHPVTSTLRQLAETGKPIPVKLK